MNEHQPIEGVEERADWMRILALAEWRDLADRAAGTTDVAHELLRRPETGMVMLRGRMGSTGASFNLGEATVTRCAVKLSDGIEGHAYVLGRNGEHARIAAICDALLQDRERAPAVQEHIVEPLRDIMSRRRLTGAQKAAGTKVDFFTLVRGDD